MQRVMTFVHGSNLFTAFKHLDVYVDDYEALFRYFFEQSVGRWRATFASAAYPPTQHVRTYWYVVDYMDEWDLNNQRTRQHLAERFQDDREVRSRWMAEASRTLAGTGAEPSRTEQVAFAICYDDMKVWYEKKQGILNGMNRFYHAVESSSDFITMRRAGRWKVDMLHKTITEKGLDVRLAVDLVALLPAYDVALLVGGDADSVPSIEYLKHAGKQVGVIELLKGTNTEVRGRSAASPLKIAADFTVPISEAELVKQGLASKGEGDDFDYVDSD